MTNNLMRREAVIAALGIKKSTFHKMVVAGELPAPIRVTGSVKCWLESEIRDFINARVEASRNSTGKSTEGVSP